MCLLKVFKLCRKADAHQDDFILRADVLETGQFHIVSASNCDELRYNMKLCQVFWSNLPYWQAYRHEYRKFCIFLSLMGVFQQYNWCFFEGGNYDLQMKQKYVS